MRADRGCEDSPLLPQTSCPKARDLPDKRESPILNKFPFEGSVALKIVRNVIAANPFTILDPCEAILGAQDGAFEP